MKAIKIEKRRGERIIKCNENCEKKELLKFSVKSILKGEMTINCSCRKKENIIITGELISAQIKRQHEEKKETGHQGH